MSHDQKNTYPNSIEERLLPDEHIIKMARIHWGIFWQTGAVLLIALLFGTFVASELGIFLLLVTTLVGLYAYARSRILLLAVTNKRILFRYGLLQVDVVDMHFDKIESVELERMPTAYLMGYSNVIIMGTGQRFIKIPYVANGPAVRRAYNELALKDK